jgi:broad specificity phosphatase PhoE
MAFVIFVTHPEVTIDPAVPVPEWSLSALGVKRMRLFCDHPFVRNITQIFSSGEKKARDGADMLSRHLGLIHNVDPGLAENDRSATGYLPKAEFVEVAKMFFKYPCRSISGWERAIDAQRRMVTTVHNIVAGSPGQNIALISHGGVGTLLMCHLRHHPISLSLKPPAPEGGCYFALDATTFRLIHDWLEFENDSPLSDASGDWGAVR